MLIYDRWKAWVANAFLLLVAMLIVFSLSIEQDRCGNSKCRFIVNLFGGDLNFTAIFLAIWLLDAITLASIFSIATLILNESEARK